MNNNILTRKMSPQLILLTKVIFGLALILAIATFFIWYNWLYMNDDRRFWKAIDNSMSTPSVVRTITEGGSGNEIVQDFRFHYSPIRVVENKVVFTQKSATTESSVETQGIVFYPQEQYLKYNAFSSTEEGVTKNIDTLLNKWANQTSEGDEAEQTYENDMITLAIFGNYDVNYRKSAIEALKSQNVYGDNIQAEESVVDGEKILNYNLTIKLKPYIVQLGEALKRANFNDFPPLDPANYRDDSVISATISVRKRDSSIVNISFSGRQENYKNYGVVKEVTRPTAELTVPELQQKVTELLQ